MTTRPDLLKLTTEAITKAVAIRDAMSYAAMVRGEEALPVIVCLGSGRCMYPKKGAAKRTCAFCLRYPEGRGSSARAEEVARIFVGGN